MSGEFLEAANVLALVGIVIALVGNLMQQARATRVELQENYLKLELASVDIFRFEAEKAGILGPYMDANDRGIARTAENDRIADNFYLQQLNLFEIAARFRRNGTLDKQVFGSWVMWFYDVHDSWWFRKRWRESFRDNYTADLKAVFDAPVGRYDPAQTEDDRKRAFFRHVASKGVFDCPIIMKWLD